MNNLAPMKNCPGVGVQVRSIISWGRCKIGQITSWGRCKVVKIRIQGNTFNILTRS